ncbi:MAG: alpha/beta family hydrolase [Ekhidna sp.]
MELFLNDKLGKISVEIDEASNARAILIMAHGAGAGMLHPFMQVLASKIALIDITTIRFNFPYMEQGRKSPGSPKTNIEAWKAVVDYVSNTYPDLPIFTSGKSYGGRMASHLIAQNQISAIKGIIYFGFPLHAPGRDSIDRAAHLADINIPQLFLQGSKDKLANPDLMNEVVKSLQMVEMELIEDADHSFNVPKRSGKTKEDIMDFLAQKSEAWMKDKL